MKNRSKIGNKKGNPAYRTASFFREKQFILSSFPRKKMGGFIKIAKNLPALRGDGFQKIEKNNHHLLTSNS